MSSPIEAQEAGIHWLEVVRTKVAAIRFGSVQITVHEGRVTQIEAIEKTRIGPDRPDSASKSPPGRKTV